MSRLSLLLAGLLLLPVGAAQAAPAEPSATSAEGFMSPPLETRTAEQGVLRQKTRIRYDDLDLSTPAGARLMFQRIEEAAGAVCATPLERSGEQRLDLGPFYRCRHWAVAAALSRLDNPAVTAASRAPDAEAAAR
jgi:UrcA family protein